MADGIRLAPPQDVSHAVRQDNGTHTLIGLRLADGVFALPLAVEGAAHLQRVALLVEVAPLQSADLAAAQAGHQLRLEEVPPHLVLLHHCKEVVQLRAGEDTLGLVVGLGRRCPLSRISGNDMGLHRVLQRGVECGMDTLRLLTAQQYERASAMICACDLIRKSHEDLFGKNRITIGLWVGSSTTPNKVSGAVKAYEKLYRGEGSNPFVMLKCPWCGAQMGPVQKGKNQWELPGYRKVPLGRRRFGFAFRCRNHQCDFSTEDLPLFVVDESIYEETPTLLLGTVDKFAMLPFRPNAQKIFGYENGVKKTSPDLIIQDELHLISGPLGSMVGHYETLIHELCTTRTASGDIHPKIIASTATISRAKEQCHALYGCDQNDVFQFPPSGLDAGNSFFAEEKRNQNGRRYVGILATGSSSDATTAIRLFASLLYGAKAMRVDSEKDRDPYWTNIGYYNSIRELGQAATWIRADIDQHLDVMYKRRFEDKRYPTKEEYRKNRRYIWRDEELTSRISGSEVTASLANLGIRYPGEVDSEGKIKEHPIDICLATNMISVGLDVSRLGLMTVAGQPKTTSEYIQATSRVGRDAENAPGLVFVLYRPGRPRDKSHYEQFRSYSPVVPRSLRLYIKSRWYSAIF